MKEWESVADELYFFIISYCAPSAMTPPDALRALRRYEILKHKGRK